MHSCSLLHTDRCSFCEWKWLVRKKKRTVVALYFSAVSIFQKFRTHFCAQVTIQLSVLLCCYHSGTEVLYVPCRTVFVTNNVIHKDSCNVSRLGIMNILLFVFSKRKCEYNANIWHERHTIKIPKIDYCDDCLNCFRMCVRMRAKRHSWNNVCFSFDAFHGPKWLLFAIFWLA